MGLKDAFNFRKPPKKEPPASPAAPSQGRSLGPAGRPPQPAPPSPVQPLETVNASEFVDTGGFMVQTGGFVRSQTDIAALHLDRLVETFTGRQNVLTQAEPLNPGASESDTNPQQTPVSDDHAAGPAVADCELAGTVINGLYRIDGLLAQGGMGQVFLAFHTGREIPVVLKLMLRKSNTNDTPFQRFMQECRITHRLRHPNVVKVIDYGILLEGFKPYLVMEFVPGKSLRQILRRKIALLPKDIARILCQACDGLHEVHGKGIIHRDLKPENIMVRGDFNAQDNVKILDFGIAQLENDNRFDERGWAVGSVGYMSPEQIMGKPVDHRTDVYSMGLILYESITGRPPFRGENARETMAMHVKNQHVPPSQAVQVPHAQAVDAIVARALAKEPDMRYANMLEFKADLERLINS